MTQLATFILKYYKALIISLCSLFLAVALCACSSSQAEEESANNGTTEQTTEEESSTLVVYFSCTDHTTAIAENISQITGADLWKITPSDPYTEEDLDYENNDNCRANEEQADPDDRPEIADTIDNLDQYDIIFIGHPIWQGEEPRIIDTFLETYDLNGKTVIEFCTSDSSDIATAYENVQELEPKANWIDAKRFDSESATYEEIEEWISSLELTFQ